MDFKNIVIIMGLHPKNIIKIIYRKVITTIKYVVLYSYDFFFAIQPKMFALNVELRPIKIDVDMLEFSGFDEKVCNEIWRMYKNHRFDILGSGWVQCSYNCKINGFEGYRYETNVLCETDRKLYDFIKYNFRHKDSKKIVLIHKYISKEYQFIDWQRDYKSGYRWSNKKWYRPVELAKKKGGDIKVPWELSRLQHLLRFPILYWKLINEREKIRIEYCDQIFDFIAQNPIRMGVNYMCTMDVGIRLANLSMSFSFMKSVGACFDKNFESCLCNYIYHICGFVKSNLERSDVFNSNHYFADLAGLLYGAAILPDSTKKIKWLTFARDKIGEEICMQFNEEGTNKEASVPYHRLTTEMALYSIMLVNRMCKEGVLENYSEKIYNRIFKACKFLQDVERPDGQFPAIGDNDSGVFFRFSFTGKLMNPYEAIKKYRNLSSYKPLKNDLVYYDENMNDGRPLLSAWMGLFCKNSINHQLEYPFEKSLTAQFSLEIQERLFDDEKNNKIVTNKLLAYTDLPYTYNYVLKLNNPLRFNELNRFFYEEFGLYIYKSEQIYLCICMTDNGQNGIGGHAHNDKLSFELIADNKIIFEDPGTYVYTADVDLRNKYRSTKAHNTLWVGEEQNGFMSIFSMKNETKCKVLKADKDVFVGEVIFRDYKCVREFQFKRKEIIINDFCNKPFESNYQLKMRTNGYGKKLTE